MLPTARFPDVTVSPARARTCSTCCARRRATAAKSQTPIPTKTPMAPTMCTKSARVSMLITPPHPEVASRAAASYRSHAFPLPRCPDWSCVRPEAAQEDGDDRLDMLLVGEPVGLYRGWEQFAPALRRVHPH